MFDITRQVGYGFAFTTTTNLNAIVGTSEVAYLLLKNTSSNPIMTTHFLAGNNTATARTVFRIYLSPTIVSNGTALTVVNTWVSDSAPASECEAYKDPSVSSFGTILNMAIIPANSPSRGISRNYRIDPGKNILVTIENSVGSAATYADVYWTERQ